MTYDRLTRVVFIGIACASYFCPVGVALADCSVSTGDGGGSGAASVGRDDGGGPQNIASSFDAPCSGDVSALHIYLKKQNSPTFTAHFQVWSDTPGKPAALVSGADGTIDSSSLTSSYVSYDIFDLTATLTSGTTYWLVFDDPDDFPGYSNTNYVIVDGDMSQNFANSYDEGTSWTGGLSSYAARMTLDITSGGGGGGPVATTTDFCPPTATSTALGIAQQGFCDLFQSGGLIDTMLPPVEMGGGLLFAMFVVGAIVLTMLGGARSVLRS